MNATDGLLTSRGRRTEKIPVSCDMLTAGRVAERDVVRYLTYSVLRFVLTIEDVVKLKVYGCNTDCVVQKS